jgi:GntR family transcriptional regulator, transcriptional repressor for pyruvate dehydrogenase complex
MSYNNTTARKAASQAKTCDFTTIISRYDKLGGNYGKTSKVDQIVSILVEYIKSNNLEPGTKLPNEKELCNALNISSRSLREALITLATLGLLEARHGSGWYVGKFDPSNSLRIVAPIIQGFWKSSWEEIMYSRLAIESITAYLAARNITSEGIAELELALRGMENAYQTNLFDEYRRFDRAFHQTIAEKCGNSILAMQSSMLTGLFYYMTWWTPQDNMPATYVTHQKIFSSIRDGQAEEARRVMGQHLEYGLEWFAKNMRKEEQPQP